MRVALGLAAALAVAWAATADACGCGAVVAPTPTAGQRIDERSIIHFDGSTEKIAMRLSFGVPLDRAALVLPVPRGASVALGDDAEFDRIDTLTAPRVEHRDRWHIGFSPGDSDELDTARAPTGAGGGGPSVQVVGSQDLGPLHVATLRSRSASELEEWLRENGFPLPSGLADGTQAYLDDGWDLVVAKLRAASAGTPLRTLQPLAISFASDRVVYPLRLSARAVAGSHARLDVYAPWRVEGTLASVLYAGDVGGGWLTSLDFVVGDGLPARDPVFVRAADQTPYQRVTVVYRDRYVADTAAPVLAGLVGAMLAFWLVRRRGRRLRPE